MDALPQGIGTLPGRSESRTGSSHSTTPPFLQGVGPPFEGLQHPGIRARAVGLS